MRVQRLSLLALQIAGALALRMVGLGSSYAAGPALPKGSNYNSIVAQYLGADLIDLSVSGSTLLSMSSQIAQIPTNTDIVTITSGGNDLGYIGGLLGEGLGIVAQGPLISEAELVTRFNNSINSIFKIVPKSQVYLVEYLTILGPDVKPGRDVPFDATRVAYHQNVAAILQRATEKAAETHEAVTVVRIAYESQTHGLGSASPWVNGPVGTLTDGAAWHPNALGMKAVSFFVDEKIKENMPYPEAPPPVQESGSTKILASAPSTESTRVSASTLVSEYTTINSQDPAYTPGPEYSLSQDHTRVSNNRPGSAYTLHPQYTAASDYTPIHKYSRALERLSATDSTKVSSKTPAPKNTPAPNKVKG
jgi:hypothetical protein